MQAYMKGPLYLQGRTAISGRSVCPIYAKVGYAEINDHFSSTYTDCKEFNIKKCADGMKKRRQRPSCNTRKQNN